MGAVVAPAPALPPPPPPIPAPRPKTLTLTTTTVRRSLLSSSSALILSSVLLAPSSSAAAAAEAAEEAPSPPPPMLRGFEEIPGSGGVKALELRAGSGQTPVDGDQVAIHYYGRLGAKQGWRFDSTNDHKDAIGDPVPFVFVVGSAKVIPGIEAAVKSMRVGGVCRVIIPPLQGYQNTSQEPIPPNVHTYYSEYNYIKDPNILP